MTARTNAYRSTAGLNPGRKTRARFFSDLVILATEQDSHDDCMDIIETTSKIFLLACASGLLPRGAIAWGEVVMHSTVTVGRPLVEAHRLEQEQDWAGIALCQSVLAWNQQEGTTGDGTSSIIDVMEQAQWVIPWPLPLKSRVVREGLAVNWLLFADEEQELSCLDPGGAHNSTVRRKIANTKRFYRHLRRLSRRTTSK